MPIKTILFDLDETLYPSSSGLWQVIGDRIDLYLHDVMKFPSERIAEIRKRLFTLYGTTLRGLQVEYQVDAHEYLRFVHDIPLDRYLNPNPQLRSILMEYPEEKLIFTNADFNHASRVLHCLGLEGCFSAVIDILTISPYCKPQKEAFEIAVRRTKASHPKDCVMIDDNTRNLAVARSLGMYAIKVGGMEERESCDIWIPQINDLPEVLPATMHTGG